MTSSSVQTSPLFTFLGEHMDMEMWVMNHLGIYDFLPSNWVMEEVTARVSCPLLCMQVTSEQPSGLQQVWVQAGGLQEHHVPHGGLQRARDEQHHAPLHRGPLSCRHLHAQYAPLWTGAVTRFGEGAQRFFDQKNYLTTRCQVCCR